ncbi:inner nuclear membrane protein enriched at telomere/subtelomere region [Allomyces javanicus]|nr:inner nuclear membrane protein enriched at telomere/subtelomere region [Allomyces javanicus]
MLGTMMDQNPYWLDAGFNANSATKQDLRRWLSAYGVPMPMSDLKKAALIKLWNDHVVPNREKLRRDYHTLLDAAGLSPIGNVTPARLHDVEVSASTPPPPAAAAMFAGSSANAASAVTPRRVIRRAPADRAPWSEDDDEDDDDDDDDEVEILGKKPAPAPARRRAAAAKGNPTTKAAPRNNKRRRPASPTPDPASPTPAPAPPAPPVPARAGRAVTRAMARRQQQAAVPAPPAVPAMPPAKRLKTTKARSKPAAAASKPAAPAPAPKSRKRAATKRHLDAIVFAKPASIVRKSTMQAAAAAAAAGKGTKSAKAPPAPKPKPDRLDKGLGLLSKLFYLAMFGAMATYFFARYRAGYCSHHAVAVYHELDTDDQTLPTSLAELVERLRPTCKPCPAHAVCQDGSVVRCSHADYILRRTGTFGQDFECVPDTARRVQVDTLVALTVQSLRATVGERLCASSSTQSSPSSNPTVDAWVPFEDVRDRIMPTLAHALRWSPEQTAVYLPQAIADLLSETIPGVQLRGDGVHAHSDDPALLSDDDEFEGQVWITVTDPAFPLSCRVRRETRAWVLRWWPALAGAVAVGIVGLVLRRQYHQRLWRRGQIEDLTNQVLDLLMEQDQIARDDAQKQEPAFLGIVALRDLFGKELGNAAGPRQWETIWAGVEANLAKDPNVRLITSKHRGEIMDSWQWIGFNSLKKFQRRAKGAAAGAGAVSDAGDA